MENKVSTIEKIIELKAKVEKLIKLYTTTPCVSISRENEKLPPSSSSTGVNTRLLFTIMSIVDSPVTVHVKDGSVYSGIFSCSNYVEGHFSIVLKQAIVTKKGKKEAAGTVDSIQIPSEDLLKLVAKASSHFCMIDRC
ncbi:hypothetical protein TSUD_255060 [Trifolium subterraneum]|uniref:Ataxin 2 SM domain-containing protein n=1 Tax=Trifolium subterraneum TaxID=3900 RepID=A0A2Z6LZ48_TRISU|nr:hypothetical protein TSUD_255060 [Trifolium subterraneum]